MALSQIFWIIREWTLRLVLLDYLLRISFLLFVVTCYYADHNWWQLRLQSCWNTSFKSKLFNISNTKYLCECEVCEYSDNLFQLTLFSYDHEKNWPIQSMSFCFQPKKWREYQLWGPLGISSERESGLDDSFE